MKGIFLALGFSISLSAYAGPMAGPGRITITDDTHSPVGNATILIGMKPGDPFMGNVLTTNSSGQADLPSDFKSELPVTVSATNYITQTYVKFKPSSQMIQLHHADGQSKIEIGGNTTNYPGIVNGDGKVHFGLVLPALSRAQMLSFDMSTVVSPENDQITVVGQKVEIPSNIALPKQSQTYIVMPINLNKPSYRYYVRNPGTYRVDGLHGWFPLKQVVDDIRNGKSILDEINYLNFTTMGSVNVTANSDITGKDIAMNQSQINVPFTVHAPMFDDSKAVLSLALGVTPTGQFYPTDLKRMTSGEPMQMNSVASATNRAVLQAMISSQSTPVPVTTEFTPDDFFNVDNAVTIMDVIPQVVNTPNLNQVSFVIQNAGDPEPEMLPLIAAPTISANEIQVNAPQLPPGLQAVGTYVVYSDILPTGSGSIHSEIRTRLWEVWTDGFVNSMTLPQVDFPKVKGHQYRWELLFLAKPALGKVDGDPSLDIDSVTHVSRNILNVE